MKVLITGAGGMLAQALVSQLMKHGHDALPFDRVALDVTDPAAVRRALRAAGPDAVVQCAAYTRVDDAEHEESRALEVNARATSHVAEVCRELGVRLIYPSTDYVFAGTATVPYPPAAPTSPINAYGRSKLAGEVASRTADSIVVRTSWLYGAGGRNFVDTILTRARGGARLRVVDDQRGAPTSTTDLATAIVRLLAHDAPAGIYHATNGGETTWFGLASAALELAGIEAVIEPCASSEFPTPARRPAYSVLDCSGTYTLVGELPHWRDALAGYVTA